MQYLLFTLYTLHFTLYTLFFIYKMNNNITFTLKKQSYINLIINFNVLETEIIYSIGFYPESYSYSFMRGKTNISENEFINFDWNTDWMLSSANDDGNESRIKYIASNNLLTMNIIPNNGTGSSIKIPATEYIRKNMEEIIITLLNARE